MESVERVAMLITHRAVFGKMYLKIGFHDEIGFEHALIGLYTAVLKFECSSIRCKYGIGEKLQHKKRRVALIIIPAIPSFTPN